MSAKKDASIHEKVCVKLVSICTLPKPQQAKFDDCAMGTLIHMQKYNQNLYI